MSEPVTAPQAALPAAPDELRIAFTRAERELIVSALGYLDYYYLSKGDEHTKICALVEKIPL